MSHCYLLLYNKFLISKYYLIEVIFNSWLYAHFFDSDIDSLLIHEVNDSDQYNLLREIKAEGQA